MCSRFPKLFQSKARSFVAMIYGRPCTINDTDCSVRMVGEIDLADDSPSCPGFESTEARIDGSLQPVTIHSYHRYKAMLYEIAYPITRDMYFHKDATMQQVVNKIQEINEQLLHWKRCIPIELRLSTFAQTEVINADAQPVVWAFRLQALALALSYENIQLLLHRPLIAYHQSPNGRQHENTGLETPEPSTKALEPEIFRSSKNHCWLSAMRVSQIIDYPDVLRAARTTQLSSYVCIQTFNAGVMLGIFALSDPLSTRAQEAKIAISRLIKIPNVLGFDTAVWSQSGRILEDLLRLIMAEEMKSLLSGQNATPGPARGQVFQDTSPASEEMLMGTMGAMRTPSGRSVDLTQHPSQGAMTTSNIGMSQSPSDEDILPWIDGNFSDALSSLQNGDGTFFAGASGTSWMWGDSFSFV